MLFTGFRKGVQVIREGEIIEWKFRGILRLLDVEKEKDPTWDGPIV